MVWFGFSTHILPRRMTHSFSCQQHFCTFQLTSSQGGWRWGIPDGKKYTEFSTHILPRRMTECRWTYIRYLLLFNSHPPKEDDDGQNEHCICELTFQLTSSQGGWRYEHNKIYRTSDFSTHILPRRMTCKCSMCFIQISFSTHILPRRMTSPLPATGGVYVFQLTSSQGGWRYQSFHPMREGRFSTHILPRRMTSGTEETRVSVKFFNSHPPKEDDISDGL